MGVVVCIAMLFGLGAMMLRPDCSSENPLHIIIRNIRAGVPLVLFGSGTWNAFWYGIANSQFFWGKAALVSGLFMIAASIILVVENQLGSRSQLANIESLFINKLYQRLRPMRIIVLLGLGMSFLLYAITLIQLNLGYPIIR